MQASHTYKSRIALGLPAREQVIALLNQQLADTIDLYSQTKQAHWNVKGAQFYQVHLLFDKLAGEQADAADLIAERATTLGGVARGTADLLTSVGRGLDAALWFLEAHLQA